MRRSSEVPVKTSLIPFASRIEPDLNGSQYREESRLLKSISAKPIEFANSGRIHTSY
jgi:hypothetical protein